MIQSNSSITQIRGILFAIEKKQIVSLLQNDSPVEVNSILLGADFDTNELLISKPFPEPSSSLRLGETIWLRIKSGEHYLMLQLVVKANEHGLVTARIVSTTTTTNRRWRNRVTFSAFQGPEVRINREFAPNLDAKLHDLSPSGAAIDFWGKDLSSDFARTQTLTCTMSFNNHFELSVDCKILSSKLLRTPSCHTRLRLRFAQLDALVFNQLNHFVDATQYGDVA